MALFNEEVEPWIGLVSFKCKTCARRYDDSYCQRVSMGKEASQIETRYSPRFTSGRDGDSEEENMGRSGCKLSGEDMLDVSERSA
jgi:hypothetical protein